MNFSMLNFRVFASIAIFAAMVTYAAASPVSSRDVRSFTSGNVTTALPNGNVAVVSPIIVPPLPPTNGSIAVVSPIIVPPLPPTNGSIAVVSPIIVPPLPPTNGSIA